MPSLISTASASAPASSNARRSPNTPSPFCTCPGPVSHALSNTSGCRFPQDFLNFNENLTGRTALLCETRRVGHFRPTTVASNIEKI